MDASDGAKHNGNGHADPAPASLPSAGGHSSPAPQESAPSGAPVSSSPAEAPAGAPEPLIVVDDDVRDENGRIKKGKTLNKKGRPPGIPNLNGELVRAIKKFRIGQKNFLELFLTRALQDVEYAKLIAPKVFSNVDAPAAAGGVTINNSTQATAHSTASHDRLEELRGDPRVRDAFCDLVDRIAERRGVSVSPRNGSN